MLRIRVCRNTAAVNGYFADGAGEYYADGGEAAGRWGGREADRLGLSGRVDADAFARLCDNRYPATGQPLTPRIKAARRVGWDVSFHCPKSVSVLYGLTADPAVLAAFHAAIADTMAEAEGAARTRVRRAGADGDRVTGGLVWATFIHLTARPVGGTVDPHLHAHCFVPNLTFDEAERRYKALQPDGLYRDARYFEAAFHARLAAALRGLGYDTYRTPKGWEVAGLPAEMLRRFSRRTALIERVAAEAGITDAREKDALGGLTRERKRTDQTVTALRAEWWARLTAAEQRAVLAVRNRELPVAPASPTAARDAVRFAVEHVFEREAVVGVRKLLAAALRAGVGEVLPAEVAREVSGHGLLIRARDGGPVVTTPAVAAEEAAMVAFARDGRGRCRPLGSPGGPDGDPRLSAEQRAAVVHVLDSTDRVTVVRGAAGTGKTTLMTECVRRVEEGGHRVTVLAPTAEASRGVLRGEGFATADTLARFLADREFQASAAGQVVWVDEAGLVGSRDIARLFHLAADLRFRVVLGGDRFQHRSVQRGSVLKLLEVEAGLAAAEVTAIRRQSGRYRQAVALLARGRTAAGLDVLDALGWVREIGDAVARTAALAAEYLAAVRCGRSVLVVSPTHDEGRQVTDAVRAALRRDGRLDPAERLYPALDARDLTAAERGRPESYSAGDVVEFHARASPFRRGERWTVVAAGRTSVGVRAADGRVAVLPLHRADRFAVYTPVALPLAVGDRIRVTRNGRAADGCRRVHNGSLATVTGFAAGGGIQLDSGAMLPAGFAHIAHGYVATSHAAQGKTVDRVLIAESGRSFGAAGREQFYVSVSRGRERATVYTDDAAALRRAIDRRVPEPTATELVNESVPSPTVRRGWLAVRRFAGSTDPRSADRNPASAFDRDRDRGRAG